MQRRRVEVGQQRHRIEDADDGEPLVAERTPSGSPLEVVDAEPLGRHRAEHDRRVAAPWRRRGTCPAPSSPCDGRRAGRARWPPPRCRRSRRPGSCRCAARWRRRRWCRGGRVTGPIRRIIAVASSGSVTSSPKNDWPGLHLEPVGAERVELGQQVGPARRRDAEHRHQGGDADGDAEGGERGAQRAGCAARPAPAGSTSRARSRLGGAAVGAGAGASVVPSGRRRSAAHLMPPPPVVVPRLAAVADRHAPGQRAATRLVVGDEHDGGPARVQVLRTGRSRRRCGCRGCRWARRPARSGGLADEGPGDGDPLALAARERRRGDGRRGGPGRPGRAPARPGARRSPPRHAGVEQPEGHVVDGASAHRAGGTAGTRTRCAGPAAPRALRSRSRATSWPSMRTVPDVGPVERADQVEQRATCPTPTARRWPRTRPRRRRGRRRRGPAPAGGPGYSFTTSSSSTGTGAVMPAPHVVALGEVAGRPRPSRRRTSPSSTPTSSVAPPVPTPHGVAALGQGEERPHRHGQHAVGRELVEVDRRRAPRRARRRPGRQGDDDVDGRGAALLVGRCATTVPTRRTVPVDRRAVGQLDVDRVALRPPGRRWRCRGRTVHDLLGAGHLERPAPRRGLSPTSAIMVGDPHRPGADDDVAELDDARLLEPPGLLPPLHGGAVAAVNSSSTVRSAAVGVARGPPGSPRAGATSCRRRRSTASGRHSGRSP